MDVLQAKDLKKIYGSGNMRLHALDGVDLSVQKANLAIVGHPAPASLPTACWVSWTALQAAMIMVDGQDIFSLKEKPDHLPPQENRLCVPSI